MINLSNLNTVPLVFLRDIGIPPPWHMHMPGRDRMPLPGLLPSPIHRGIRKTEKRSLLSMLFSWPLLYSIIMLDACPKIFMVTLVCPLSFKMRSTLFNVRSSSRKHPVCAFCARLINSAIAASSTSYPSR